jgi:hypothetical protein
MKMRRLLPHAAAVGALAAALGAAAQSPPPRLEPLEAPPPPPPGLVDEPRVRIPVRDVDKVEEIREGGRIVMLKVTPPGGATYYLVDTAGTGNWVRRDSLETGVRVPMWPIQTFE